MPAKSQQQLKLIYAKRNQYGNKSETPEKWKWVWDEEWTDVKFDKLPEKVQEGNIYRKNIIDFIIEYSKFGRDELEEKTDEELIKLFDEVGNFLQSNIKTKSGSFVSDSEKNERLIIKFDNFVNEGLFINLMKTKYLVKYKVINYKDTANHNKHKDNEVVDEWESPVYEYVLRADNCNEAELEFTRLWNKESSGIEPSPKLVVISCEEVEGDLRKHGIGSFKNKINLY